MRAGIAFWTVRTQGVIRTTRRRLSAFARIQPNSSFDSVVEESIECLLACHKYACCLWFGTIRAQAVSGLGLCTLSWIKTLLPSPTCRAESSQNDQISGSD